MHANENVMLVELSSILKPAGSKVLRVVYVSVEGGVFGEEKPVTVSPMTELLKLPTTLMELAVRVVQVPVKSMNALHDRLVAVK